MTVREATLVMFKRYKKINTDFESLCTPPKNDISGLIDRGISDIDVLPIDKLSRWLGFIQGYLIYNKVTSVDAERDFSRPYFHQAYEDSGIDIPEPITIKEKQ